MLKFSIQSIPADGLMVSQDIPPDDIGLSKADLDLRSPVSVSGMLTRTDNIILADLTLHASYGFLCARCLEDIQRAQSKECHFDYEIQSPMDIFDVGEDVRQELILSASMRVLCKKDCKGICPNCGVNLNHEKCQCL